MRPSRVAIHLERYVRTKISVMLWGQPGIGKSDIVYQLAGRLSIGLIDQRLSQMESVDLRGIPSIRDGITFWNTPDFLPQVARDGAEGILFLDEVNSSSQGTQAAAYQLVLDRRLGNYRLPDGWAVIAAGNNETDRAIVNKMATPLRNRFGHLDVTISYEDWRSWGLQAGMRDEVLGFMAFRSQLLNQFEDATARNQKAFATPRTWEFVSRMWPDGASQEEELELFSSLVGPGPATELIEYVRHHRTLPDIDALLEAPTKAPVPKEPPTLYAMVTTLAARATMKNFDAIVTYIKRLGPEYGSVCITDALTRDPKLAETEAFGSWAVTNGKYIV